MSLFHSVFTQVLCNQRFMFQVKNFESKISSIHHLILILPLILRAPSPEARYQQPTLPVKQLILKPEQRMGIIPGIQHL